MAKKITTQGRAVPATQGKELRRHQKEVAAREGEGPTPAAPTQDFIMTVEGKQLLKMPNFLSIEHADVLNRILGQTTSTALEPPPKEDLSHIATRVRTLATMNPTNTIEAMLCNQMIAVNDLALHGVKPSREPGREGCINPNNLDRAAKLMKLFLEQLEAYQKLKGLSSQQKVTVEHVHVHEGGQAIVGAVAGRAEGRGRGKHDDEQ